MFTCTHAVDDTLDQKTLDSCPLTPFFKTSDIFKQSSTKTSHYSLKFLSCLHCSSLKQEKQTV